MSRSRVLQVLVAISVLLAFGKMGAEAIFSWTLPPALAHYQLERFANLSRPAAWFRLSMLPLISLLAIAAWIGLASFWRHARRLTLVSWATWLVFLLFTGARVTTSVGVVFGTLEAIVGGMIIGLVYFSDLAQRFEPTHPAAAVHNDSTGRAASF